MSEGSDMPPEKDGKNIITIPADMLGGMSPKDGDKLTFCVTGEPDKDGVMGYFEPAKGEEESWEKGFLKEMSPRNNDQPEVT